MKKVTQKTIKVDKNEAEVLGMAIMSYYEKVSMKKRSANVDDYDYDIETLKKIGKKIGLNLA